MTYIDNENCLQYNVCIARNTPFWSSLIMILHTLCLFNIHIMHIIHHHHHHHHHHHPTISYTYWLFYFRLTAFVLKSFWRGRPYLSQSVNSDMEKGLKCLITKQTKSGQFVENGVIYHKAMQVGGTFNFWQWF